MTINVETTWTNNFDMQITSRNCRARLPAENTGCKITAFFCTTTSLSTTNRKNSSHVNRKPKLQYSTDQQSGVQPKRKFLYGLHLKCRQKANTHSVKHGWGTAKEKVLRQLLVTNFFEYIEGLFCGKRNALQNSMIAESYHLAFW